MNRPPFNREMRDAGMAWKRGKKHWKLMLDGELVTIWPQGATDPKDRNAKMTFAQIERRLRQQRGTS